MNKKPIVIRKFIIKWTNFKRIFYSLGMDIEFYGPFIDIYIILGYLRIGWVWYDVTNKQGFWLGKNHYDLIKSKQG